MPAFNQKTVSTQLAALLRLLCSFLMLVSFQSSVAQGEGEAADVEEIVVTSQRSLRLMRLEVEAAENEIYEVFNEIYADTDYEITCTRERAVHDSFNPITTSPWTARVCRSRLAHSLHKQEVRDYGEYVQAELNGEIGTIVDSEYFEERNIEHNEELRQKVNELLAENPEYREKFEQYARLKLGYEAAVEADFAKGNFFTNLFRSGD